MGDGGDLPDEWARYLKRATDRPGWSVARLAREAGLHRSTIFRWMTEGGEQVTIASVRAIATALGDDFQAALRAAANIPQSAIDAEISAVANAEGLDDETKMLIIQQLEEQRATDVRLLDDLARRDRQRRSERAAALIDQARRTA